VFVFFLCRLNR